MKAENTVDTGHTDHSTLIVITLRSKGSISPPSDGPACVYKIHHILCAMERVQGLVRLTRVIRVCVWYTRPYR